MSQQPNQTNALREVATGGGAAVPRSKEPQSFPAMLEAFKPQIAAALPKHLNADRMARVALTCFRQVPKLAECKPVSVFAAVIQAAQLGLEPGLMGEAYLIPYGSDCQLIPGYAGLIKLAKQTGQVVDIYAMAVREHDEFSCTFGLNRTIVHNPKVSKGGFPASQKERGEIIGHYAVAVFRDGTRTFVVMGMDEILRVRDGSSGWQMAVKYKKTDKSPWGSHPEEMGNKTVIRRLCKTLPKSPELAQALALDDASNNGQPQSINLKDAIEGSFAPVHDDDQPEVIDNETGEIIGGKAAGGAVAGAAQDQQSSQQSEQSDRTTGSPWIKGGPTPTIHDAIALVQAQKYDEATDLISGSGFVDADRQEVAILVKKRKKGENVA